MDFRVVGMNFLGNRSEGKFWNFTPTNIGHSSLSCISHALADGRTLAEVRDAAGHSNVSITSGYLHVAVEDEGLGSLFG